MAGMAWRMGSKAVRAFVESGVALPVWPFFYPARDRGPQRLQSGIGTLRPSIRFLAGLSRLVEILVRVLSELAERVSFRRAAAGPFHFPSGEGLAGIQT